jgi:hypothetical protein
MMVTISTVISSGHVSKPIHCVDGDNAAHRVHRKLACVGVAEGVEHEWGKEHTRGGKMGARGRG